MRWWWIGLCVMAAGAEELDLAKDGLRIPCEQTQKVVFGTVPQKDTTVLLELECRMDSPGLGGSSFFMDLTLNGRPVKAAKSRTALRLVNKPLVSPVAPNLPYAWYGGGGWRVLYAPDFEAARKQAFYTGDPYTLVLDITDLTNPAAENRLEIKNNAAAYAAKQQKSSLDLVIRRLKITTKAGASPTMSGAGEAQHQLNRGTPAAGPAKYRGELLPGGGLAVELGGRRYVVSSDFSYPNAGLNHLGDRAASGQPGWQATAQGGQVTASGPDYSLRRTVDFGPRRVLVRDTLTNAHRDAKLGLLVRHQVRVPDGLTAAVRLAGNADPSVNVYYSPPNPTVHLGLGQAGLGLVCEDDVLRNQAELFFDEESKSAGVRTDKLLLQPGGTVTLEWSLYPVASPEYYDFINLVRQDWGSNYTTEGPWMFFGPDEILKLPAAELKARLDGVGMRFACSWGGWVDGLHDKKRIGFGTEVASAYWADYRLRLKDATAKLHAARPGLKVLIYYDTQRDTYLDAPTRYPDSKLTGVDGQQSVTDWGVYSTTYSTVATVDNSYGKAMLNLIDVYLDDIGADGLYWDEMENVAYGAPLWTAAIPDGKTCLLDPKTYTIKHEIGLTTLLGEGHRLAVIDKVRAKGGTLMGNGPGTTKALLAKHVQRMVEIQHNEWWSYEGHLQSPLGYDGGRLDFGNVTRALDQAMLLVNTRSKYPYEIIPYLFPLTPLELHNGYLLAQERIIVKHSGDYGWPGAAVKSTLRVFDKDGKLKSTEPRQGRVKVDLAEGEVAVIVREAP